MDQSENDISLLHDASGVLKARDAALFVVGVGSGMDDPSVKKVASKDDYAFHATSFSELMSVAPLLSDQICPLKGMFMNAPALTFIVNILEVALLITFSFLLVQILFGERFESRFSDSRPIPRSYDDGIED